MTFVVLCSRCNVCRCRRAIARRRSVSVIFTRTSLNLFPFCPWNRKTGDTEMSTKPIDDDCRPNAICVDGPDKENVHVVVLCPCCQRRSFHKNNACKLLRAFNQRAQHMIRTNLNVKKGDTREQFQKRVGSERNRVREKEIS